MVIYSLTSTVKGCPPSIGLAVQVLVPPLCYIPKSHSNTIIKSCAAVVPDHNLCTFLGLGEKEKAPQSVGSEKGLVAIIA